MPFKPLSQRKIITLDFETFYKSKADYVPRGTKRELMQEKYSLRSMTTYEYLADPRFKIHCVSVKLEANKPKQIWGTFAQVTEQLKEFFELHGGCTEIALLCQNTKFDASIMVWLMMFPKGELFYLDTRSMLAGMFPGFPASLEEGLIRMFPDDPTKRKGKELAISDGVRTLDRSQKKILGGYCDNDCDMTYELFKAMEPYYPDEELMLIHINIRMFAEPSFEVDLPLIQQELDYQSKRKQEIIAASGLPRATLSSNAKFPEWIKEQGIRVPMKTSPTTGKPTPALGKSDLEFMKLREAHPEFEHVWAARVEVKSTIQQSRAQRFQDVGHLLNGAMPIALNYYGANTGRYSGAEKLNQQNLTRINPDDPNTGRLRRSLLAPAGYQTIVADSSNIEARVLAWICDYEEELTIYRQDGDVYKALAARIYAKIVTDITKGERSVGKVSRLGLGYGMGADKFWYTLNTGPMGMPPIKMLLGEAQRVHKMFRTAAQPIVKFWALCESWLPRMMDPKCDFTYKCLRIRYQSITLPNGMVLRYNGLRANENRYGGYSFEYWNGRGYWSSIYGGLLTENIVQALARIIVTDQLLVIDRDLQDSYGLASKVVHMVHDENIAHVPDQHADEALAMMLDVMAVPPEWCSDLPISADGGYAREYSK